AAGAPGAPHHPPDRALSRAAGALPGRVPPAGPPRRVGALLGGRAPPGLRPQALLADQLPRPAGGAGGHRPPGPPPRPPPLHPPPPPARGAERGAGPPPAGRARGPGPGPPLRARSPRLPGGAPRPLRGDRRRRPPLPPTPEIDVMTLAPFLAGALAAAPPSAPMRVSHVYLQHLEATPDRVLPLLTPLGERAWAVGWEPEARWEPTGGGPGTLFVTRPPGQPETGRRLGAFRPAAGPERLL